MKRPKRSERNKLVDIGLNDTDTQPTVTVTPVQERVNVRLIGYYCCCHQTDPSTLSRACATTKPKNMITSRLAVKPYQPRRCVLPPLVNKGRFIIFPIKRVFIYSLIKVSYYLFIVCFSLSKFQCSFYSKFKCFGLVFTVFDLFTYYLLIIYKCTQAYYKLFQSYYYDYYYYHMRCQSLFTMRGTLNRIYEWEVVSVG